MLVIQNEAQKHSEAKVFVVIQHVEGEIKILN